MDDTYSDEEIPLPRPQAYNTAQPLPYRKRSRGSHASTNSSDPPYFSSDDLAEASVDNYVSPRRKRQVRRAWWEDEGSASIRHDALKRASKRAKDSGVFMSSDSNSSSPDEGFSIEPIKAKLKQKAPCSPKTKTFIKPPTPPSKKPIPHPDHLAQQRIQYCLENDADVVDLA